MIGKLFTRSYSCQETMKHLQSYLDGETDPKTTQKVADHLANCPPCDDEFHIYEQIKARIASPAIEVDPAIIEALNEFGRRLPQDKNLID